MSRTPHQEWRLKQLGERVSMREMAQEVECTDPGCEQPAGEPCLRRDGVPLEHMDHISRYRRALAKRAERSSG